MLKILYWVLGIGLAICIVAVALVVRFVLYGLGIILIIVIIGGIIATGLQQHAQSKKPPD